MGVKRAVQWLTNPTTSLNSWGVRLIIAAVVALLLTSILLLQAVNETQAVLDQDRKDREVVRTSNLTRTCLILEKLNATVTERKEAGCP